MVRIFATALTLSVFDPRFAGLAADPASGSSQGSQSAANDQSVEGGLHFS